LSIVFSIIFGLDFYGVRAYNESMDYVLLGDFLFFVFLAWGACKLDKLSQKD
jgi:hypothetical protein